MPPPFPSPRLKSDWPGLDEVINELAALLDEARNVTGTGLAKVARVPGVGTNVHVAAPRAATPTWLMVAGAAGIDGGYPWQALVEVPLIQVTAGGSGYTFANASASGGGGTGPVVLDVRLGAPGSPQEGKVVAITAPTDGSGFSTTSPDATVAISGDGSGAAAVVQGQAWVPTGDVVSSDDLAYEATGCRSVPAMGTVASPGSPSVAVAADPLVAARSPSGRLLFFSRPVVVAKTTAIGTYPSGGSKFYAVVPQVLSGAEAEGQPGAFAPLSSAFFALNIGTGTPPVGSPVVARWRPRRWSFQWY
jgi:hypothetical protein